MENKRSLYCLSIILSVWSWFIDACWLIDEIEQGIWLNATCIGDQLGTGSLIANKSCIKDKVECLKFSKMYSMPTMLCTYLMQSLSACKASCLFSLQAIPQQTSLQLMFFIYNDTCNSNLCYWTFPSHCTMVLFEQISKLCLLTWYTYWQKDSMDHA